MNLVAGLASAFGMHATSRLSRGTRLYSEPLWTGGPLPHSSRYITTGQDMRSATDGRPLVDSSPPVRPMDTANRINKGTDPGSTSLPFPARAERGEGADCSARGVALALDRFQRHGDTDGLLSALSQSAQSPESRAFIETHQLLHLSILQDEPALFDLCLAASVDPNQQDSAGNTPLHLAQNTSRDCYTRALLQQGADPNLTNRAGETPLRLAANTDHYQQVIALLAGGATLALRDDYFSAAVKTVGTASGQPSQEMQTFLLNLKLLFQLNDIKTDGLEVENELRAKEKLFHAIADHLSPQEIAACEKSLALDQLLRHNNFPVSDKTELHHAYVRRCDTLSDTLRQMGAGDFRWLSNGSTEHALNMILYKNLRGDFELTVINSGDGSEHHQSNTLNQIKPKTYRFQPPAGVDAERDRRCFERELISVLAFLYTARYEKGQLHIDALYKTLDRLADYERPCDASGSRPPAYTKIVSHSAPPIDHQMADNCSTESLLGGMYALFPERVGSGQLEAKYENYLLAEMEAISPDFSREWYLSILNVAQTTNDLEWVLQKARMLFAKSNASSTLDPSAVSMLEASAKLFEQAADRLNHSDNPSSDVQREQLSESRAMVSLITQSLAMEMTPKMFVNR